eukprot:Em0001g174a
MESEVTSDNSDETSDESEVVAGQEDPKPGPSQLIYHNNPIITFGDIGFMSFTAAARPCIDDATKELLVKTGPDAFRNEDATLPRTLSGTKAVARGMTKNWFHKSLPNGQQVPRTWLLYSPHKSAAYCFCCLLFPHSPSNMRSALESPDGFTIWKKSEKLKNHEECQSHRKSFLEWKEMERALRLKGGVDEILEKQVQDEKKRWREILKRIIDVIKLLASQNLALRGHVEQLDSDNPGNFLATLKFLSFYDTLLENHLKNVRENPHSVSYLSHDIQNEFLSLLAGAVRDKIIKEIKEAKYFGILYDSTPDVSHTEQLSQVIRYVQSDFETGNVRVKETFIKFVELDKKDAAGYEAIILKSLQDDGLNFLDCRAQSTRLRERNPKAVFINCDNHSLNLAGVHAASVDPTIITFFETVQEVYSFFSGSTTRWKKMSEMLDLTVKKESDTRWSAREAAHESTDTRAKAGILLKSLLTFNCVVYLYFWNEVLLKINVVQKRLQSPNMNLHEAATDLDSLWKNFTDDRDNLCARSLQQGLQLADKWEIATERRMRRKRLMPGESEPDAGLSVQDEASRVMKLSLDTLCQELQERSIRLQELNSKFGFLLNVQSLINGNVESDLVHQCADFGVVYEGDVNGAALYQEITDCQMLFANRQTLPSTPEELLKATIQYGKYVFPNLQTALQILLTMPVSVASCERSFSKLKIIKTYLRSTMAQERLGNLAILSIEKEVFNSVDFDQIIDQFAEKKSRKASF